MSEFIIRLYISGLMLLDVSGSTLDVHFVKGHCEEVGGVEKCDHQARLGVNFGEEDVRWVSDFGDCGFEDLSIEIEGSATGSSGLTYEQAAGVGADIPKNPEEGASFDWVANLNDAAHPFVGYPSACLSAENCGSLTTARMTLVEGDVSTCKLAAVDRFLVTGNRGKIEDKKREDVVPALCFRPDLSKAVAEVVVVEFGVKLGGNGAEKLKIRRVMSEGRDCADVGPINLRMDDCVTTGLGQELCLNIVLSNEFGGESVPAVASHFVHYYDFLDPDLIFRPIPHFNAYGEMISAGSVQPKCASFLPGTNASDQHLCPIVQYP